eukprot:jgi/Mesen1/1499/ME000132S00440
MTSTHDVAARDRQVAAPERAAAEGIGNNPKQPQQAQQHEDEEQGGASGRGGHMSEGGGAGQGKHEVENWGEPSLKYLSRRSRRELEMLRANLALTQPNLALTQRTSSAADREAAAATALFGRARSSPAGASPREAGEDHLLPLLLPAAGVEAALPSPPGSKKKRIDTQGGGRGGGGGAMAAAEGGPTRGPAWEGVAHPTAETAKERIVRLASISTLEGSLEIAEINGLERHSPFNQRNSAHWRPPARRRAGTQVNPMDDLFATIDIDLEAGGPPSGPPHIEQAPPMTVKFEDVKYSATVPAPAATWLDVIRPQQAQKRILHGITGSVQPGELLALMGPSGSGKTTFLNLLGGRGSIAYDGHPYSKDLKRKIGYVAQDDLFAPTLTVRETLVYAALLRLPRQLTRKQKVQRVDAIISDLGLDKSKNTIIGNHMIRGVSGGERKRVSVAHEILTDPSLLLLDEPTSGLDSTTALRLIQVLLKLSQSGRTVVTTIHQPSSRLFHSFDKLLLLAEGHSVFCGRASEAMPYFGALGFAPLFATNPADFILDIANGNLQDCKVPERLQVAADKQSIVVKKFLPRAYKKLLHPAVLESLDDVPAGHSGKAGGVAAAAGGRATSRWSASWTQQFGILWQRGFKERRAEYLSWLRVFQVLLPAFICGLLWFNLPLKTEQDVRDQMGLLFFFSEFWGLFPLFISLFTFPAERAMLAKERASDMYRLSSYFLSRSLADIPLEFVLPVGFLVVAYFMAGLRSNFLSFLYTLLTLWLTILVAQNVPSFISWLKYLSYFFHSYRLLVKIQFDEDQTLPGVPCGEYADCPLRLLPETDPTPLGGGAMEASILVAMLLIYRLLAYLFLLRMKGPVK